MPAETKTITVWANDHAEFVQFCADRGWNQPPMFRAILERFKEAEARDEQERVARERSEDGNG